MAEARFARAIALEDAGLIEEALAQYRELLAEQPSDADAWHNHGLLLARLGRLAAAEQSHRSYLHEFPDDSRAHSDLADVLLALDRPGEALDSLDWIVRRKHADVPALVRRALALSCLRRLDEAGEVLGLLRLRHARELQQFVSRVAAGADPETVLSPENVFLSRCYAGTGRCDWSGWDAYVAEMRRGASRRDLVVEPAVSFMALHLPLTASERHAIAQGIANRIETRSPMLPPPELRRAGPLRIGILSPDFREHLNAYLLLPLFELLDRKRFAVYAYSLAPDDGSEIRNRTRAAADRFIDLHGMKDADAAGVIRHDDVDILVDVAGHSTGGRFGIVARRPARVQAAYLGFPGSLGSRRVDYVIVDHVVATLAGEWSEKLIPIPETYFLYDFRTDTSDAALTRADYGLPANAFVYCAFHKPEKITPDIFNLWLEILAATPESVLWLLALPQIALENLRARAVAEGIDGSRLVAAPYDSRYRYLARQKLGDLFLDTLHHSAMTTACDALGSGLPLLTITGTSMASRAGQSIVSAAGLPELVAADQAEYKRMAVELAADRAALGRLARKLRENRHSAPLFDTSGRVRALGDAFEEMWKNASSRH